MNAQAALQSLGLPPIDQIGFVVKDLKEALARYEPLFGPFVVPEYGPFDSTYRGRPTRVHLVAAFGRTGDVEIELIEWRSGDTPHRDFIAQGREGVHHLRYRVADIAAWAEKCRPLGYESVWSGSIPAAHGVPAISWCYLERPGDLLMIEFIQMD